ncbi:Ubiquitin carboxyl-terminal hydrolase ubh-4 [Caenorhabditis elegans]|uniref:Ubiquitin carboxyl-terminal hydrolase ubh-4 n=1 Tax=Caenorhabditis elegans TaxID=6239 RepID=UBH4_CAEEL|nr:Ubiquitin carboxyl-terminal hydrolase ubh-4 [Caenorhabditis elegans]Q09444.2 RecName: Full=Ubiquitin carboxyl-terminal hydrolase ubh-4; AltName: Full=Ubiquitin C-terminal hydrolase family 1 member 4; AltName: Full=Ubiquitin thioesterase 4 [Caenorhabditis elegans]CAA86665.2 Ubiquitin carboxyl-terminal hydrolase ubh-4 [Caenorhabditis elegans]|eukprot:NP_495684.2 Ubiquitin carboxyl-terminal hydrolase ubh-4 [Caenorhabditis elegans]
MTDAGSWCLIESDPGVFTEMLRGFGVDGLQVEELYSLDDDKAMTRPTYGLIFLFKWRQGDETTGIPSDKQNIFFAHQTIQNACATQALINLLMNVEDTDVKLGNILNQYKEFAIDLDPNTRGHCLSNSEEIRTVHNSFSRQTLFELDIKGGESEDNYHFVTYVPIGNKVYELDGLRELPLEVAEFQKEQDWIEAIKPVIQQRMQKYSEGEITFNLMALVPNRKQKLQEMMENLIQANENNELEEQIADLNKAIADEDYKMEMYRKENNRRRHNYTPFVIELMKILAKEGKLVGLVDNAYQAAKEKSKLNTDITKLELKRKQ